MNLSTVTRIVSHATRMSKDKNTILDILRQGREQGHHERLAEHVICAAIYEFNFYSTSHGNEFKCENSMNVVIAEAPSFSTDVYASADDYGVTYSRKTNLEYHLIFVKDIASRVIFHELIHALVGPEFSFTSNGACGVLFDWLYDNTDFIRALTECARNIVWEMNTYKIERKEVKV